MAKGMNLDDIQIIYILGEPEYDNLGEPTPWSNKPEILKGLTITFLVCNDGGRTDDGFWPLRRQANFCSFDRPCHGSLFASDSSYDYV